MARSPFCCSLCWEPPNLFPAGEEDHDWMFCDAHEARDHPPSFDKTLNPPEITADHWIEHPSPCRNPESPLDQKDLDRFHHRTTALAANTGYLRDPEINLLTTPPEIESMAPPQPLLALCQGLQKRLTHLKFSKDELVRSFEQDIEEIRELLTEVTEAVTRLDDQPPLNSPPSDKGSVASGEMLDFQDPCTVAPDTTPEAKQYIQAWHNGGLIIVENLSEYARTRDIHDWFNSCGQITFLELHGADKSKPHINSRFAYIDFAEYDQAISAVQNHHGALFQDKFLMVFLLSTDPVRGEPGSPYLGSALEILNFAGGHNYASPEADFRRDADRDMLAVLDYLDSTVPLDPESTMEPGTYSLKPILTAKTTASWRRSDTPKLETETAPMTNTPANASNLETSLEAVNPLPADIQPLAMRQPGAYIPPKTRKRKAGSITGLADTDLSRPCPVKRVLKRGEPLNMFFSGLVDGQKSKFARLDVADFGNKGKQQSRIGQQAAINDGGIDDEEGGVLL
ncbi:MAG: hypothetical protein Q9215_001017 [Flavoplaca cf. flavocitrina]